MTSALLHQRARELDANDALAARRTAYHLPRDAAGQPLVYLCGHSLGLEPVAARNFINEELDDWARLGVEAHATGRRPWVNYAELLQPMLAPLVGSSSSEVVAMNSLTVNLHLLLASFYRPAGRRRCVVMERGAFSSDRHAIASQIAWHGLDLAATLIEIAPAPDTDLIDESALETLLTQRGDEVALVLWPGVQYRTGQAFDLRRIALASHAAGAVCGFDLAHSIGNMPLQLHDDGADFAVWCSYKYLNGGPGALAGAFVHASHDRAYLPGLAGWWGHEGASRFRMEAGFLPEAGAAAWQVSNPSVLAAAPLLASLPHFSDAGMRVLRDKSLRMTEFVRDQMEAQFASSLQCVTPAEPARHGCQLSLRVRAGRAAGHALFKGLSRHGVTADWREPDILRIAPVPLYNTFEELARFCDLLRRALDEST